VGHLFYHTCRVYEYSAEELQKLTYQWVKFHWIHNHSVIVADGNHMWKKDRWPGCNMPWDSEYKVNKANFRKDICCCEFFVNRKERHTNRNAKNNKISRQFLARMLVFVRPKLRVMVKNRPKEAFEKNRELLKSSAKMTKRKFIQAEKVVSKPLSKNEVATLLI